MRIRCGSSEDNFTQLVIQDEWVVLEKKSGSSITKRIMLWE